MFAKIPPILKVDNRISVVHVPGDFLEMRITYFSHPASSGSFSRCLTGPLGKLSNWRMWRFRYFI